MSKITAPFTPEQVTALNRWQQCDWVPEFRCHNRSHGPLIASESGWSCSVCTYRQNWAHHFMAEELPTKPTMEMLLDKTYLGDSVYVEWDDRQIRLMTWNGHADDPRNQIFLEPEVWRALCKWVERRYPSKET